MPNLYGYEVRMQSSSSNDINNYTPIIKIFAENNFSTANTSYITQGINDNGNISIRTFGNNNYVELAAGESSNNNGQIPNINNSIKVSYNNGIQFQNKYIDVDDKEKENNLVINNGGISLKFKTISFSSQGIESITENEEEEPNKEYSFCQITDSATMISTPAYVLSSNDKDSINVNQDSSLNQQDYLIKAIKKDKDSKIQLIVGDAPKINLQQLEDENNIITNQASLQVSDLNYIKLKNIITTEEDEEKYKTLSSFKNNDMELSFTYESSDDNTDDKNVLILKNDESYIKIASPEDSETDYKFIELNSDGGVSLNIAEKVIVKGEGGLEVSDGAGIFNNRIIARDNIYTNKDIYLGCDIIGETSSGSSIRFYKDTKDPKKKDEYVILRGADLEKLLD